MKSGIEVLADTPGTGSPVERHRWYDVRLQMWLSRGDPVRWTDPWGLLDHARIEDAGTKLFTTLRVDREFLFAGLLYGVEGMRVGGMRRLRVAPHLAYRETGILGAIPPNALLTVEIEIISQCTV